MTVRKPRKPKTTGQPPVEQTSESNPADVNEIPESGNVHVNPIENPETTGIDFPDEVDLTFPIFTPLDDRVIPEGWNNIFTRETDTAPGHASDKPENAELNFEGSDSIPDRWLTALGRKEEYSFQDVGSPFITEQGPGMDRISLGVEPEQWDDFETKSVPTYPPETDFTQTTIHSPPPTSAEEFIGVMDINTSPQILGDVFSHTPEPDLSNLSDFRPEFSESSTTSISEHDIESTVIPDKHMFQREVIPDLSPPEQISKSEGDGEDTDWQSFFIDEHDRLTSTESAPGFSAVSADIPGADIKIGRLDRIRQFFHLTRSEWITIAAVTTLAIFSLSILFFIRFMIPWLSPATPAPLPNPTSVGSSVIFPIRIEFGGYLKLDLTRGIMVNGKWDPKSAEWLEGTELRKVIAIPYSKEMLAVFKAQAISDKVIIHMNNATVIPYKITEIKEISRSQTDILNDTHPSIVVILIEPGMENRWVIIARK